MLSRLSHPFIVFEKLMNIKPNFLEWSKYASLETNYFIGRSENWKEQVGKALIENAFSKILDVAIK